MKLWIVALALAFPDPAIAACHVFSVWHFNYPQPCGRQRQSVFTVVPVQISAKRPSNNVIAMPLPDLTASVWGDDGGEQMRGRLLLRAALIR